ncbi:MAG: T9SS type A sorting domain-containing protein [Crocinitomicaceae bacterium]|nr:T9SS type A sorting domain-containing protein [Crocinitomicaceae bacterium]
MRSLNKILSLVIASSFMFLTYGQNPSDACGGVPALTVNGACITSAYTLPGAYANGGLVNASCFAAGNDRDDGWYSVTATSTGTLNVELSGNQGHTLAVFSACGGGTELACQQIGTGLTAVVSFAATNGVTYYVQVHRNQGNNAANMTGTVCAYMSAPGVPNDECAGAVGLTVNPDNLCGTVTNSTIAGATASVQDPTACFGTEDDDVWFSFVATGPTHMISLLNIVGGTTDLYHSVWEGVCPGLTLFAGSCSDPNSSTVTGLTPGNTYYLRVYSWTGTAGQTSVFDVCIGTPPPPPANDECAGAIALTVNPDNLCGTVTTSTIASATPSVQNTASCGGTEDDDVWFSFVATGTAHMIDLQNISGGTTDLYHSVWSGVCPALTVVAGSCSDPNSSTVTGLTPGNTYYVRVYSWTGTAGQTSVFDICIGTPPPPPANDECSGAIPLTVNPDQLCGTVTTSTIASATPSAQNTASCGGTEDDDVWFSFVATSSQHYIDLINIFGGTTDLYHSVWEGVCPALTLVAGTCSDPNSSTVTGLTPGNTYYVRVYSWTGTTGQTSVFDICIGSDAAPTCVDGIQNQGETGVDCGGPCPACPPPSCVDGIQNQGETDIDCGGPCPACPPTIIPTACTNSTHNLTTLSSVVFYDDGGAGGDPCADVGVGTGNYANANCFTTTTICAAPGEMIVADFREFAMWNTTSGWDWMKIYDGPNTGSPLMYDNSSTGPDNPFGDCGIGGFPMEFCSTGQCMTFEFWATSVVNRAGWDCLVTSVDVQCIVPLPIELGGFEVGCGSNMAELNWTTISENNNDFFTVEKSTDGYEFNSIGTVDAIGNSMEENNYRFNDVNPENAIVYYRLKQTDVDGKFSFSTVVASNCGSNIKIYPNPTVGELFIDVDESLEGVHSVIITDVVGNVVQEEIDFSLQLQTYQVKNFGHLKAGMYVIQIVNSNREVIKYEKVIKE